MAIIIVLSLRLFAKKIKEKTKEIFFFFYLDRK